MTMIRTKSRRTGWLARILSLGLLAGLLLPLALEARELRIAYVDIEKVLEGYLDLKESKEELNRNISDWRTTRDSLKSVIDTMKSNFDQERPMLSDEAKISSERAIQDKEEEYQNYWRSIWGDGGKVDLKTKELVEPLTKRVQEVINEMAQESDYDLILDISAEGVRLAVEKGWLGICTNNFCQPHFEGVWSNTLWHQQLTSLIRSGNNRAP